MIFEESHNAIKSKGAECPVGVDVLDVENTPLYLEQGANTSAIYSDEVANGNKTFPHVPVSQRPFVEGVNAPILVGTGERPIGGWKKNKKGESVYSYGCGETIITGICDNCLLPVPGIHQCKNKGCPNCWELWVDERSKAIVDRLLCKTARLNNFGYRLVGLIVSPPDTVDPDSYDEVNMWIDEATKWIKSKGVIGASLIPHFWRVTNEGKRLATRAGYKYWDWIHLQASEGKNWRQYTKKGLHFHLIGYVKYMEPPKSGEPFIYETMTNDNGSVPDFRLPEMRDRLIRLVKYNLDHTAAIPGGKKFDSVRWIGSLAGQKFEVDVVAPETRGEEAERQKRICPECGGNVRERWEAQRMYFEGVMSGEYDNCKYVDACMDTFLGNPPPPEGYVKWTMDRNGEPPPDECFGGI